MILYQWRDFNKYLVETLLYIMIFYECIILRTVCFSTHIFFLSLSLKKAQVCVINISILNELEYISRIRMFKIPTDLYVWGNTEYVHFNFFRM